MKRPDNRIAIVEHDPDNRVLIAAMLSPRYDVIAVERSGEALPAILRHRPHVVLWDVGDDDRQGARILDRLRRDPPLDNAAIVAVTASVRRDANRYWLWLGFDGVVAKPILDKSGLWRIIDDLCRGGDLRTAVGTPVTDGAVRADRVGHPPAIAVNRGVF